MGRLDTAGSAADRDFPASDVGNPVQECCKASPSAGTTTAANRIDIVFDPDKSSKVTRCDKIVHVQFMRYFADGKVINAADYSSSAYAHKRNITTDKGYVVDCLSGETTPDYQQGTGDGSKGGATAKATMMDAPQTGGGDAGFYDPVSNKSGWKNVRYEFSTYAYCMAGPDCGKWYEGVTWSYKKSWKDNQAGRIGTSKVVNDNVTSKPPKAQIDAFDKFNADKGFTPCA